MNLKAASLLGLAASFFALVALVLRRALIAQGAAGLFVQALSLALMIAARVTFGRRSFNASAAPTRGGLVTGGPYKYLRHPIYAAALYLTWAGVLTHFSAVNFLIGLVPTAGLAVRMLAEEHLLKKEYPEYAAYAGRVKRVIPFMF
ncbi:MAG TPA: methyltransferase [Elusimicrobiales bacterium]|nr:methyltransferase [Elusimicrobiales bacterium]